MTMIAMTSLGTALPPCLHPLPRKEALYWVVIWVFVVAAVTAINLHPHGINTPLHQPAVPLSIF